MQDLLHSLLRLHFDDIRPEEWTPSYGGGASRMDFLLKDERIVIEAKMARANHAAKEISEELIIDAARYKTHPDCKTLVCLVYDPNYIKNPRGVERDGMTWRSYASSRRNLHPLPRSSPVSYNHENIYVYQPQVPGEQKRMKHSYPTSEALKFLLQMAHNREMALPDFQGDFVWDPSRRMSLSNRLSATIPPAALLRIKNGPYETVQTSSYIANTKSRTLSQQR